MAHLHAGIDAQPLPAGRQGRRRAGRPALIADVAALLDDDLGAHVVRGAATQHDAVATHVAEHDTAAASRIRASCPDVNKRAMTRR